ncbi:MBL fold metallo-hydrolase [Terrihabitans sp. B22-R8]|uniref:MBL fold metallo-hydrolase n=1 Tax=Terrihabitans sp. B22-R8 TaxID=3425128 RepID=UPI00403C6828
MTKATSIDQVTRRTALFGAGAAALAVSGTSAPVQAASPAAGRQVPGISRYKLGDFELMALNDGINKMPLKDGFVSNAPFDEVKAAMREAFLPEDELGIQFNPLLINTGRKLVLIDAGTGGQLAPTAGMLVENMEVSGLDPKSVDAVVISHFHFDHVLGLTTKEGEPVFPNAEIFVPEPEWAYWMDDGEMSRASRARLPTFQRLRELFGPLAKDITRYKPEQEVIPGIVAHSAFGHTPGHMTFRIASGSEQMMSLSDTTNHPALFVRNPGWHVTFDMDPAMAEATRRRLLDMVAADRMLVHGYHFPFPSNGHIAKDGDRFSFVPSVWSPIL